MSGPFRLIVVDASEIDATRVVRTLEAAGWQVATGLASDELQMREALRLGEPLRLRHAPGGDGEASVGAPPAGASPGPGPQPVADPERSGAQIVPPAQKADSVGSLAAGVAHHFNNMLSVVLGHSDLILAELAPADPLYPGIEQIRSAGQSAADLTRQLLAFSQQQFLRPRVVDLNQIVTGVERMLRKLVGEHIELSWVAGAELAAVNVDPVQIEQVIMNLVANAREAMPDGGQLALESNQVVLDSPRSGINPGPYVVLSVADTGVGMAPEVQARIFEPYFTTKPSERTGLGLCTALGIVRQSGGAITVQSQPGRGATFKVYLPRADGEATAAPPAPERRRGADFRGTETILVTEDDERVRAVVRTILRKQGYRVLEASNAGEALLVCEQRADSIDLLLTDVVMPRMSGRKLAERVAAIRAEIKVVYMSGYTDDFVFRQGVLERGMAFLQKPIRPDMLAQKVREVLDAGKPRGAD